MNKRQRKKALKNRKMQIVITKNHSGLAIVTGNKYEGDFYPYHCFPIGSKVIARHYDSSTKDCVVCDNDGNPTGNLEQYIRNVDLKFI